MSHLKKFGTLLIVVSLVSPLVGCCLAECKGVDKDLAEEFNATCQESQQAMLTAVNEVREKGTHCGDTYFQGVPALTWDAHLAKASAEHAQDMAENNYFDHESLDGRQFSKRAKDAGYAYSPRSENIHAGSHTIDKAVQAWVDSDAHCENMMEATVQHLGMACAYDRDSKHGFYWVQKFGKE